MFKNYLFLPIFFAIFILATPAYAPFVSFQAFIAGSSDPTTAVLPAYNDAYANWQNAGMLKVGGIPTRTTQCGSTVSPSGLTPPTTGDDADLINAAITACTPGDVVQLASGTFQIDSSEDLVVGQGITLRGNGNCTNASTPYCNTVINIRNGALQWTGGKCGVNTSSEVTCGFTPAIAVQPAAASNVFDFGLAGSLGSCNLTASAIGCGTPIVADIAQRATTVQVTSTTGFSAGGWVVIDEASGSTWVNDPTGPNLYGQIWSATDWLSSSGSPATGRVQWAKYGNGCCDMGAGQYPYNAPGTIQSMYDRATTEIHLISSVGAGPCPGTNCTVTFDDPVMVAFRESGAGTFTGTIINSTLTTIGDPCTLTVAQIVADTAFNVPDGDYVTAVNSCSGGVGNYTMSISHSVSSETMIYAAHQAHLYYPTHNGGSPMAFVTNAGVENLTISKADSGGVNFQFCGYCWTYKVEVVNWYSGAFNISYAGRVQIDTSFSNFCGDSVNNGAEYPIGIQNSATEAYVVNTIIIGCGKGMVGKGSAGAVVAYNYEDDTFYDYFSAIGNYWEDMGVNGSHWAGTHHFLFEGNWGNNCDNDNTHGNQVYLVYFRNNCTGYRTPFTDPSMVANGQSANAAVNDFMGIGWQTTGSFPPGTSDTPGVLRTIGPQQHDYWFAYVGNVLGTASETTSTNGWVYSGDYTRSKQIWMPGWNSDANNPSESDPNLTGATGNFQFKHGNFDYYDNSIVDWTSGYSMTLPNSFYTGSKPAFFSAGTCTYPWPWVTSQSSPYVQTNSCSGSGLPAKARYVAGTPFVQP